MEKERKKRDQKAETSVSYVLRDSECTHFASKCSFESFQLLLIDILPGEASKGPDKGSTNMQEGKSVQDWLRTGH